MMILSGMPYACIRTVYYYCLAHCSRQRFSCSRKVLPCLEVNVREQSVVPSSCPHTVGIGMQAQPCRSRVSVHSSQLRRGGCACVVTAHMNPPKAGRCNPMQPVLELVVWLNPDAHLKEEQVQAAPSPCTACCAGSCGWGPSSRMASDLRLCPSSLFPRSQVKVLVPCIETSSTSAELKRVQAAPFPCTACCAESCGWGSPTARTPRTPTPSASPP